MEISGCKWYYNISYNILFAASTDCFVLICCACVLYALFSIPLYVTCEEIDNKADFDFDFDYRIPDLLTSTRLNTEVYGSEVDPFKTHPSHSFPVGEHKFNHTKYLLNSCICIHCNNKGLNYFLSSSKLSYS